MIRRIPAGELGKGNSGRFVCGAKNMNREKGDPMDGEMKAVVERLEMQMDGIEKRLNKFEQTTEDLRKSISDLSISITKLTERLSNYENKMDELTESVNEIKSKPGKRWDGVITAFLAALVGALVAGYFAVPK